MWRTKVNLDLIVEVAKKSGLKNLKKFRQELENCKNLEVTFERVPSISKVLKIASRMGPDNESREAILLSVELTTRILLGQWKSVAAILESLIIKDDGKPLPEYNDLSELIVVLRNLDKKSSVTGDYIHPMSKHLFNAYRGACVIACERPNCGEIDCKEISENCCEGIDISK